MIYQSHTMTTQLNMITSKGEDTERNYNRNETADYRRHPVLSGPSSEHIWVRPVVTSISGVDARPIDDDSLAAFTLADCFDYDAVAPAFEGQEAVVHLAANAPVETPWPDVLRNNIASTHNVYEAARQHGVKRIVFASSNHAVGNFELDEPYKSIGLGDYSLVDNDPANIPQVDHQVPIRPDSDYGVSKVFGEATGRYYNEHFGLEVACLRIGSVVPQNRPNQHPSLRNMALTPRSRPT